ncbi:hypothetical protein LNQ03_33305 [Klebsiella pneumoniae subsp. pneumoniae]|nr:hypothetical protein [Klebsiella pneumoniae subsp. pneumoniae]
MGSEKSGIVAFRNALSTGGRCSPSRRASSRPYSRISPAAAADPATPYLTISRSAKARPINDQTCAVIRRAGAGRRGRGAGQRAEFLRGLRQLCDQHNALLIFG